MIIERFGRYHTTLKPGLHFIIPFVDMPRTIHWRYVDTDGHKLIMVTTRTPRIDMREHVIDFARQHVITRDTVLIDIDALVYYQITDPELAVFKVQNLPDAVELLTQTTLRNLIAHMTLDDTFSSREVINAQLKDATKLDAERWGITIKHVEILNIFPPKEIQNAMEHQIREERERRSTVLLADGERESEIIKSQGERAKVVLQAEGDKTANLQRAKGKAEARILLAKAEAESIKSVREAIEATSTSTDAYVRATDYLVALEYLESLGKLTARNGKSAVVLLPSETLDEIDLVQQLAAKGRE
jgi:regulator of protease activity HflC (stomatin/prohibitin superfamily)